MFLFYLIFLIFFKFHKNLKFLIKIKFLYHFIDGLLEPKAEIIDDFDEFDTSDNQKNQQPPQIRVSDFATRNAKAANVMFVMCKNLQDEQQMKDNESNNEDESMKKEDETSSRSAVVVTKRKSSSPSLESSPTSGGSSKNFRRRIRRKHNSPDDKAEALTEMSVRGLNLFRYASVVDGVYKCTECAKENIQKTFKNKYSFQRHAFLYHEGTQRKVFPCPVCRKEFSRPDKMKNHMKMTHECYMPKECKFPIPLMIASGSTQTQSGNQSINNNILNLASSSQSSGNSILNLATT